jgi:hypothetical protein
MAEKPGLERIPVGLAGKAAEGFGAPGDILSILNSVPKRALEGLGFPTQNLGMREAPTSQQVRQEVVKPAAEAMGIEEHLKPQGWIEESLQRTAGNIPAQAALGGLSIPGLVADLSGSLASTGAKKAGFGFIIQTVADMIGQRQATKAINTLTKAGIAPSETLSEIAKTAKTKAYNKTSDLGSKIKLPAKEWEKEILGLQGKISRDTRLSEIDKNKLIRDSEQYLSDITGGKINANELLDRRTQLNSNISDSSGAAKNYYEALRKPAIKIIESERSKFPAWSKELNKADMIHGAMNFGPTFINGLEDYPKIKGILKSPLAYSLASLGPSLFFTGDPISTIGISLGIGAGGKATKEVSRIMGFLTHGTEPAKLLVEASKNMIERNYPAAARAYNKLNHHAEKYEKQSTKKEKQVTRLTPSEKQKKDVTGRLVRVS